MNILRFKEAISTKEELETFSTHSKANVPMKREKRRDNMLTIIKDLVKNI